MTGVFLTFLAGVLWGLFLALVAGFFLGRQILAERRRGEPRTEDAENTVPERGNERTSAEGLEGESRRAHLFECYVAGNDAYPSRACPFAPNTPESANWIAGWHLPTQAPLSRGLRCARPGAAGRTARSIERRDASCVSGRPLNPKRTEITQTSLRGRPTAGRRGRRKGVRHCAVT
jgi:hypothetical protein